MTDQHTDWGRWQGWRGRWTFWKGAVAYRVFMALPTAHLPSWAYFWLLPSVGDYAYWDDAMSAMKNEKKR